MSGKRYPSKIYPLLTLVLALSGFAGLSYADGNALLVFSPGQTIKASDVNSNFSTVSAEMNAATRVLARTLNLPPVSLGSLPSGQRINLLGRSIHFTKNNGTTTVSVRYSENLYTVGNPLNYWVYCQVKNSANLIAYDKACIRAVGISNETCPTEQTFEMPGLPADAYTAQISIYAFSNLSQISAVGTDSTFEGSLVVLESE